MKLTTLLLIVTMMQVSAKGFAQKISLSEKGASIKSVLMKIRQQTGYDFVFAPDQLQGMKPVSIQVKNEELKLVLDKLFDGQQLDYRIEDKSVVISKKDTPIVEIVKQKLQSYLSAMFLEGRVIDERGKPMAGVTIKIKRTNVSIITNEKGEYKLDVAPNDVLVVSYIGYETREVKVSDSKRDVPFVINMVLKNTRLDEVQIVSNGYQTISKERATGSYEVITAKALQHSNHPNLIRRLEGITVGTVINNQNIATNSASRSPIVGNSVATLEGQFGISPLTSLSIRGSRTFNEGNATRKMDNQSGIPLVVIDGIATPYSVDLINPDDVEDITILKDAAASSIWGSRAANGVIVIRTKKGMYNRPLAISVNANFNIQDKLNLFYKKRMSTSEFVDAQIYSYNPIYGASSTGVPDPQLTDLLNFSNFLSPVHEIISAQRHRWIDPDQAAAQINELRNYDIRNDYTKYLLRNYTNQNYSLNISGGSEKSAQGLSVAYANTLNNTVNSGSDKLNLDYNASFRPLKNLDLSAAVSYVLQHVKDQASQNRLEGITNVNFFPYTRLADENGNALEVSKNPYRPAFIQLFETTYGNNVLPMRYKPLDDIKEGYQKLKQQNINLNARARYNILPWLNTEVTYNYSIGDSEESQYLSQNSFYMRELINRYTMDENYTNQYGDPLPYYRQIPVGGAIGATDRTTTAQTLRGLVNVDKVWNEKHELTGLIGVDVAQNKSTSKNSSFYGYNPDNQFFVPQINYTDFFTPLINTQGIPELQIPYPLLFPGRDIFTTRTFGTFANAAYTYDRRYTLSANIRRDGSSEFGMGANKVGVPFYHIGTAWNISNEKFYKISWLPQLKFRATFGYNGNVNPLVYAKPLIAVSTETDLNGLPYAQMTRGVNANVSNRELRPEKTAMLDLGIDFSTKGGWLSGSVDYYDNYTTDALKSSKVDPSFGFTQTTFNSSDLHGYGLEANLQSINVKTGMFEWASNFQFSYNRVKVAKLYAAAPRTASQVINGPTVFDEGYDLYRLFAYKWAGLDPITGDPRGYLNGQAVTISNNTAGTNAYNAIANSSYTTTRYFGSSVPVYVGGLRNSFSYGQLSLSANITYKLGYYAKKPSSEILRYNSLFRNVLQTADYDKRWQKPGDEQFTNVPSQVYINSETSGRELFYANSEVNVFKADHIRLQEINLSYGIKSKPGWWIKNPRFYANIPLNLIVWRANNQGFDPDVFDYPTPRTYGFGFSASF